MAIFRKRISGVVNGLPVESLIKYNLQGNDVNINFYVNASDETSAPRDGMAHLEICNSQSDPRVKALRVTHIRIGSTFDQNQDKKYKGCGIGTVLLYEAAAFCKQHFPWVRRFEIDHALTQAHLFYYKLQLHTSKKEYDESALINSLFVESPSSDRTGDKLFVPTVSKSSLEAMEKNFKNLPNNWKPQKFSNSDLVFARSQRESFFKDKEQRTCQTLENELENMLSTCESQAIKQKWVLNKSYVEPDNTGNPFEVIQEGDDADSCSVYSFRSNSVYSYQSNSNSNSDSDSDSDSDSRSGSRSRSSPQDETRYVTVEYSGDQVIRTMVVLSGGVVVSTNVEKYSINDPLLDEKLYGSNSFLNGSNDDSSPKKIYRSKSSSW